MLPQFDGHYIFVLPLPLNPPSSKNATLYGFSYVVTDYTFKVLQEKETILCRGLDYQLPSPNYLFSLGIDPYNIKKGLSEESFLNKIHTLFSDKNSYVITWSIKNLKILETMCLRNFMNVNMLRSPLSVVDINKVLKLHQILINGNCYNRDSLIDCARLTGFKDRIDIGDINARLEALIHITEYISSNNYKLLAFMLKPLSLKLSAIIQCIEQNKFLLNYDSAEKSIEILKPLKIDDCCIDAVYFDGYKVSRKFYPITDFDILSPATVLTPQRQNITGINLNQAIKAINETIELTPDNNSRPYHSLFFEDLNESDIELYRKYSSKELSLDILPPKNSAESLKTMFFLYKGNNYKNLMVDSELSNYYNFCSNSINKQMKRYLLELKQVAGIIHEENKDELSLLEKIQNYPYDL